MLEQIMHKNDFTRKNQEDAWKNISDYKDSVNRDNEITVPLQLIEWSYFTVFPINIEQVLQLPSSPATSCQWYQLTLV